MSLIYFHRLYKKTRNKAELHYPESHVTIQSVSVQDITAANITHTEPLEKSLVYKSNVEQTLLLLFEASADTHPARVHQQQVRARNLGINRHTQN